MERKQSNFKISQGHFSKEDIHLNGWQLYENVHCH
jgi:hypothetical protein